MAKKWTKSEDNFLIHNYGVMTAKELTGLINRSKDCIFVRAGVLGLRKRSRIEIGKKYNMLTVLELSLEKRDAPGKFYSCICECGNFTTVSAGRLNSATPIKSCGCLSLKKAKEIHLKSPGEAGFNSLFRILKYHCKNRVKSKEKSVMELTAQEHRFIITQNCYYCGAAPKRFNPYLKADGSLIKNCRVFSKNAIDRATIYINTVDRVDSNKGYILSNCVPACWPCNQLKTNLPQNVFLEQVARIAIFQKEKNK